MKTRIFSFILLFFCVQLVALESAQSLDKQIEDIDKQLEASHNVWLKHYMSLQNYNELTDEINGIQQEIQSLANPPRSLTHRLETLQRQQDLLKDYAKEPYKALLETKNIEEVPQITNPFLILTGYSFLKILKEQQDVLKANDESLQNLLDMVRKKYRLLLELGFVDKSLEVANAIASTQRMIEELEGAQKILATSLDIYAQESENISTKIMSQIQNQIVKIGKSALFWPLWFSHCNERFIYECARLVCHCVGG